MPGHPLPALCRMDESHRGWHLPEEEDIYQEAKNDKKPEEVTFSCISVK